MNFIKKLIRRITNRLTSQRQNKRRDRLLDSHGAILIEFAICMPILIILLFYINDLVRIKRYYSQTEFVGQQMANIIQNISQKREDKRIKPADLKYAMALAYQTIYPGKTMFYQGSGYIFGHRAYTNIYYIKGMSGGNASVMYRIFPTSDSSSPTNPSNLNYGTGSNDVSPGKVRFKSNVHPSQIYPSLKVDNEKDEKIIVDCCIMRNSSWKTSDGRSLTDKQSLGLHLLNINFGSWGNGKMCYSSIVIFTPKPGLFSETAP